jgi:hypothetical protein
MYDDVQFVFNTFYDFKNRFAGEPDYFTAKGEQKGFLLTTNFVADAVTLGASPRDLRSRSFHYPVIDTVQTASSEKEIRHERRTACLL